MEKVGGVPKVKVEMAKKQRSRGGDKRESSTAPGLLESE
jgi:hypothetical protein